MRTAVVLAVVVTLELALGGAAPAHAQGASEAAPVAGRIVGFRVRGKSKLAETTVSYLAHVELGDLVGPRDLPRLTAALISSELFEQAEVTLEPAPGGVLVVATLDDKHSWIIAPTLFVLPGNSALGVGFAENNFRGRNQKILLYGQLGTAESLMFGTYLDPSVGGSKLTYRVDLYAYRRGITEYTNPTDDGADRSVSRLTTTTYLGGGGLVGWRFAWWMLADLRLRGAYVYYRDAHADDAARTPVEVPEKDGWDVSIQPRFTLDARRHRFGVTWGPYLQIILDRSIPGLDDYDYYSAIGRAYYSWRLFDEHQLELRTGFGAGAHLPLHEELTIGGATDLRGYAVDRIRGDLRAVGRAEYSLPITKWKFFAFRGIGFWDTGYVGFRNRRTTDRIYLPNQTNGSGWWRNDVGVGLRIYVKAIVLPLLGLDVAYGLEGKAPEVYFELGLTDF